MPRDSTGAYTLPAGNPVITGTVIESNWANTTLDDVSAELTNSLDRQGRGGMQASLRLADGSQSAPGLAWVSDTRSGLLREALGQWAMVADGQIIARASAATGLIVTQQHFDTAAGVEVREQGLRVYSPNNPPPGGGSTFLSLLDVQESTYVGFGGQAVSVALTEDGLVFGGGSGTGDFVGPNGATPDALVLFADPTGKLGKESTFTVDTVIRSDVKNQTVRNNFSVVKDVGDGLASIIVERTPGDAAIRLDHRESNALRGHVIAPAGAAAPAGRSLFLQESAARGVVIGQDQATPAATYADAGKDTLRVMGPIYESREGDINYRVYSELFLPPVHPVSNVGGGSHNVTLPDTSFDYKYRTFGDDFAVTSDVFSIANDMITNAKLANVSAGTFKGLATGASADPQDLRVDALTNRAPQTTDVLLAQIVGGDLVSIQVDNLSQLDTPAYTGTADARLDMTPVGNSRPLKRLVEGANVSFTETADSVTVTATLAGGGGGVVMGTPFAVGELAVVTDAAGDGQISTLPSLVAAQVPQLDQANVWTVSPQTFQSATSDGGVDIDVSQTPRVRLRSSTGLVDKRDGRLVQTQNGHLDLAAYTDAGALVATIAEFWNNGGVVLPPATGGDQGAGSINAASYWESGSPIRTALADTFTVGPGASSTNRIAIFADTSGQLLADSGFLTSDLAPATHVGDQTHFPADGTTGQFIIKQSNAAYDFAWADPTIRRTYGNYPYIFSADTNTGVDPGLAQFRVNNATAASVTQIAINDQDFDTLDVGPTAFGNMSAGDLFVFRSEAAVEGAAYTITSVVDQTGWTQLNVSFNSVATGGLPTGGDRCAIAVELLPTGGGGSGVQRGTPFVDGDLTAVSSTVGDGEINTVGFAAADVARVDVGQTFAAGQIVTTAIDIEAATSPIVYWQNAGTRIYGAVATAGSGLVFARTDAAGAALSTPLSITPTDGVHVGTPVTPAAANELVSAGDIIAEGVISAVKSGAAREYLSAWSSDTVQSNVGYAMTERTIAAGAHTLNPLEGQMVRGTTVGTYTMTASAQLGPVLLEVPVGSVVDVSSFGVIRGSAPATRPTVLLLVTGGGSQAIWVE